MSTKSIRVIKRDNTLQEFDIEKINNILKWATDNVDNVSLSDIVINAQISISDKTKTSDVHEILIKAALNCFSEEYPNYQYVASRLLNFSLRKNVWGGTEPPKFFDHISKLVNLNLYDKRILEEYTEEEIRELEGYIEHDRDFIFTYAGIKQLVDKYLVQDRESKEIFETPQFAYMLIAMVGFSKYPKETRLVFVKNMYDLFSQHKVNLPTPQMAGIRTPLRSYASCMLIQTDDTKESIFATNTAIGLATCARYGIGLDIGRIRAIGSSVKNGALLHTGVIPYLKMYQATAKSCQQNGLRGGGATVYFPWWHLESEDMLSLKNNGGTEDNRVRSLDYGICVDSLFYGRFLKGEDITLFSPQEVPDLYEAFGTPKFDEIYLKYESNPKLTKYKKTISAASLFTHIMKERVETGRIYIFHIDHANSHGAWADTVTQSNLCIEIFTPTVPLKSLEDPEGLIGICTLSAINPFLIKNDREHEHACYMTVAFLDEVLDLQDYFLPAASRFAQDYRSLGIGVTNWAAYMAKNGVKFTDEEAPNFAAAFHEKQQYFLLKASNKLAELKGPCAAFSTSKYSKGILPIDTYKKTIDSVITQPLQMDWEKLRKDIAEFGLRNCTLSAQMPVESSSVITNSTNGIEPPRELLSYKKSKAGTIPILVPSYAKLKKNYQTAFDIKNNKAILNIVAAQVKFLDMGVSTNLYYNYRDYPNGLLPDKELIGDTLYAYKMGIPSLYYLNTSSESSFGYAEEESNCAGGACTL